jgi:hypothetical protein
MIENILKAAGCGGWVKFFELRASLVTASVERPVLAGMPCVLALADFLF